MKTRWYGWLLLVGLAAGCLELPKTQPEMKPAPEPPPPVAKPRRPTNLVVPEQVNENNAQEMLNSLRDELDRDSQAAGGQKDEVPSGR